VRRLRPAAAGVTAWLLLLAGCVAVPVSGPVERHSPAQQQVNPGVEIAPVPPAQGASPGLIVEGFLHAMATYQTGYTIARQFLTPLASDGWQPETGVEIYAGGYPPQVSDSGVVLTAPLVGRLDAQGTFTPAIAVTQYLHDFGLMRDADGQWRISQPPRGLLISQSLFASTWTRSDVCFWDATGAVLVPDPRFVLKGAMGMVSTARVLLQGPSLGAQEAYRRPLGARVDVTGVSLSANGVANVELAGAAGDLNAEARRKLAAELVWSLSSLEGVAGVRVRSGGAVWEVGGTGGTFTTSDFEQGAPVQAATSDEVFVVHDGAVQRVGWDAAPADAQPLGGTFNRVGSIAARPDGQVLAAITDGGTRVRTLPVREGAGRVDLTGDGFSLVRWTRQGELLVVLQASRGSRMKLLREGREVPINTDGLPVGRVRSLAVAPDGVRVALVIEEQGRPVLGIAALVRSAQGVRFVGWREMSGAAWAPPTQRPIDVGWSGVADLLVLLAVSTTPKVVSVDSEGAIAAELGPTDSAASAQLAVSSSGHAVVRGSDGQTWRFVDEFTWEPWLTKVQQVSLP